ncbi:high frequency lysogenization protein HflD [Thiolapillus sp.]
MSRKYTDRDHALILGGVFQAARLVFELARYGKTSDGALDASVASLFQTRPESVQAVFGEPNNLKLGLQHFVTQLESPADRNPELTQYSIRLLQLGRKLYLDAEKTAALGTDLEDFQSRMQAFEFEKQTQYSQLAKIYQDHISSMSPRIMVQGDPLHLENQDTAARIRCALLAGVRAAHLWYQCGGKRWHLLTRQRRLLAAAHELLEEVT